jgi:hypothetical protein
VKMPFTSPVLHRFLQYRSGNCQRIRKALQPPTRENLGKQGGKKLMPGGSFDWLERRGHPHPKKQA